MKAALCFIDHDTAAISSSTPIDETTPDEWDRTGESADTETSFSMSLINNKEGVGSLALSGMGSKAEE